MSTEDRTHAAPNGRADNGPPRGFPVIAHIHTRFALVAALVLSAPGALSGQATETFGGWHRTIRVDAIDDRESMVAAVVSADGLGSLTISCDWLGLDVYVLWSELAGGEDIASVTTRIDTEPAREDDSWVRSIEIAPTERGQDQQRMAIFSLAGGDVLRSLIGSERFAVRVVLEAVPVHRAVTTTFDTAGLKAALDGYAHLCRPLGAR